MSTIRTARLELSISLVTIDTNVSHSANRAKIYFWTSALDPVTGATKRHVDLMTGDGPAVSVPPYTVIDLEHDLWIIRCRYGV